MELKELPLFSEDLLTLTSQEELSAFRTGLAIQFQAYGDEWMAVQGDVRVTANTSPTDRVLFERLVLRDQVKWLLTAKQKGQLLVQYCAPVEVSHMGLEIGVDELIVEDLYAKQEIPGKDISQACDWLAQHFVVEADAEYWLPIARFNNRAAKGGFQLLGHGWRADVERKDDGALLVKRVTRHVRRDSAFSFLVGADSEHTWLPKNRRPDTPQTHPLNRRCGQNHAWTEPFRRLDPTTAGL